MMNEFVATFILSFTLTPARAGKTVITIARSAFLVELLRARDG